MAEKTNVPLPERPLTSVSRRKVI